jgi:hypothetical protein
MRGGRVGGLASTQPEQLTLLKIETLPTLDRRNYFFFLEKKEEITYKKTVTLQEILKHRGSSFITSKKTWQTIFEL